MTVELPTYETLLTETIRSLAADSGVATSAAVIGGNSLSDQTKAWATDVHRNRLVKIIKGEGAGQIGVVQGNGRTSLVIKQAWSRPIAAGDVYVILGAELPLEVFDPKVGSLISYEGTTTANGAVGGGTLVCAALAALPDYDGNTVIITSGACIGQARDINGITTGGVVTPHLAFDAQIVAGVHFSISAIRTTPAEVAALAALIVLLMADVGDPTGETLPSLATKWGNIARSLDLIIGARWDVGGDLGTDIAAIIAALAAFVGVTGIFHEQADTAINTTAPNAPAETDILNLAVANTRYIVRSLKLKAVNPNPNNIAVRLYELVNDVATVVDTFTIDNANFGTYHSLMDMFGLPYLAGDNLRVTVQASAGGPYAVTAQYSHGKTNV